MFRRFASVLYRTTNVPSPYGHLCISCRKHSVRTIDCIAKEFNTLKEEELRCIVAGYNHILPTIYKQEELLAYANEDHLTGVFDPDHMYLEREELIDDIMRLCQKQMDLKTYEDNQLKDGMKETLTTPINSIDRVITNGDKCNGVKSDEDDSHGDKTDEDREQFRLVSPMLRFRESWREPLAVNNYMHATQYSQPFVVDCSFEYTMKNRSLSSYGSQIEQCTRLNSISRNPFNMHICNLPDDSILHSIHEEQRLKPLSKQFVNTTSKCYTELFDRKNLIMLSPDAPLYMEEYDNDKIYVIGGIVDLGPVEPLTLNKAKELGIECRKLPIDVYLQWKPGSSKRLTLNAVLSILLKLSQGESWQNAIEESLPTRQRPNRSAEADQPEALRDKSLGKPGTTSRELREKKKEERFLAKREKNKEHLVRDLEKYYKQYLIGRIPRSVYIRRKSAVEKMSGKDPRFGIGHTVN